MKKEIKKLWDMIDIVLNNSDKTTQNVKNGLGTILILMPLSAIFGYMSLFYYGKEQILICIVMGYLALNSFLCSLLAIFICLFQKYCDKNNFGVSCLKFFVKYTWKALAIIMIPSYTILLICSNILKFINLSNVGNSIDNLILSMQVLSIWTLFAVILLSSSVTEIKLDIYKYAYYIVFLIFYIIAKFLEVFITTIQCKNSYDRMKFIDDINKIKALFFAIFIVCRTVFGDLTIGFTFVVLINYSYNILKQLNHFDRKSKYKDFLLETLLKLEQYSNVIITAENNIEDENFFRYITSFKKLYTYINSIYPGAVKEISLGEIKMYNIKNNSKKKDAIFTAMKSIESLVTLNETDIETIKINIRETQNLICNCYKIRMYF